MKTIITVIGVLIFGAIAWLLYFASQVSAVYPPIKNYDYNGVDSLLKQSIEKIVDHDTTLSFKITDVTGYDEPHKYYASFTVKKGMNYYLFNINYETKTTFWGNDKYTDLALVGAFDETNKKGGYSKEEKGVNKMLIIFEEVLIKKLIPN